MPTRHPDAPDSLPDTLPPHARIGLGQKKGGYRVHQLHPDHAREAGIKGGTATVEKYRRKGKTSEATEHGRRMAAGRKGKWAATVLKRIAREAAEQEQET